MSKFMACLVILVAVVSTIAAQGHAPVQGPSKMTEGRDYLILERVRVLDTMGFDRPVEAMSLLIPRGWRTEGGVSWQGIRGCRAEVGTYQVSAISPDGAIRFLLLPVRSFLAFQNQMMQQSAMAAAQQGGCQLSPPFDASQYLNHLARNVLGGATVNDVRQDESMRDTLAKISASFNASSQQYGTGMTQTGSGIFGTLTWPDGSKGLGQVGVSVMMKQSRDMFTGAPDGFATTTVFHQAVIRYPPAREAEALKLFATILTSQRMNPIWQKAKENFLTQLGNTEHAGSMERLRLMGEQSAAYARAQNEASDARMRDWERNQASSDANQHRFIQTIREVETWKDSNGDNVELSAGYKYGWSRPNGSIILTNNSIFDPAVELQQNWSRMQKRP
jgi:hypothetical protein